MEGFAGHIPRSFNLLATLEGLGRDRRTKDMWRAFLSELDEQGILNWEEAFVDATFVPAKGAWAVGKTKRGKGTRYLVVVDGQGIPLGSHTDSASPAEVRLLDKVMADIRVPKKGPGRPRTNPTRVIGDKGYDSKLARNCMRQKGVNLLVPYRKNNKNVNRQDDRLWDRYRRRYIVERTFAWMGTFRRLIIRYENHISMFVAFLQLAFAFITMRKCL